MSLNRISADQFARKLAQRSDSQRERRYTFFLGAGCSRSSGIPTARELVQDQWLPRLRDWMAPERTDLEHWAIETIGYKPDDPAEAYGRVLLELFHNSAERQGEIERLCERANPGFGYAVLAQMVAHPAGEFNMVLTTNFDDLVADALYLYTDARPLVIHHESLAPFVRPTRTRPLVVKLHGDNRLSPRNTPDETSKLADSFKSAAQQILHDRGLIFIGYGGYDDSIRDMLEGLSEQALPFGVYWVNSIEPNNKLRPWLEGRRAHWVECPDFDRAMLLLRAEYKLTHPNKERFDRIFSRYHEKFETLSREVFALPGSVTGNGSLSDVESLKAAARNAAETLPDGWAVNARALALAKEHPAEAERVFEEGVGKFPGFGPLLGNYASFLLQVRKDAKRAGEFFTKAIVANPNHAGLLTNYAMYLWRVRGDSARADEFFARALGADPNQPALLASYAVFLHQEKNDYGRAEEFYRRAAARAPDDIAFIGNSAGFLLGRGRADEGRQMLTRAIAALGPDETTGLAAELLFYVFAHGREDEGSHALAQLKRTLIHGGARSRDWDFSLNVAQATAAGHRDAQWLPKLAEVINATVDVTALDAWPTSAAITIDQSSAATATASDFAVPSAVG